MDKTDILMAQNARNYALENNKINSQAAWKNPDSGNLENLPNQNV